MIINKKTPVGTYYFVLIFCLASFFFYRPIFIDAKILKVIYGIILGVLIYNLFKKQKKSERGVKGRLDFPMRLMIFSILFSVFPAYEAWKQSIPATLLVLTPYLSYLLYFYLHKKQVSREALEKIIYRVGVTCLVFYFIAYISFPRVIFGTHTADEITSDRGFARIIIGGLGFIYLLYFMALNNYLTNRKQKWLIISIVCFVGIFMTLTRQVILSSVVLSFYLIYIRLNFGKKFIVFGLIISIGSYVVPNLKFVQLLVNQTKEQSADYKDDQRYMAGNYYLTEFSPDEIAKVFGNGEASLGNTYYGVFMQNVEDERRFFQSDVGFIGFYSKFGILGVVSWLIIFFIVIKTKFPVDSVYLKLFILLILLTGLTSSMPFNENYISCIAISLYLIDKAIPLDKKKRSRLKYIYDPEMAVTKLEELPL